MAYTIIENEYGLKLVHEPIDEKDRVTIQRLYSLFSKYRKSTYDSYMVPVNKDTAYDIKIALDLSEKYDQLLFRHEENNTAYSAVIYANEYKFKEREGKYQFIAVEFCFPYLEYEKELENSRRQICLVPGK